MEKGGNKGQAAELYGQAAQLFEAENSTSEASKCRQKVGGLALLHAAPTLHDRNQRTDARYSSWFHDVHRPLDTLQVRC